MAINNSKQPEPPLPQLVEMLAEGGEVDRLLAKLNERLGWTDRLEVLRALSRVIEATGEIGGVPGLIELAFTSMLKVSMAKTAPPRMRLVASESAAAFQMRDMAQEHRGIALQAAVLAEGFRLAKYLHTSTPSSTSETAVRADQTIR
jgi:hypothetical protein